MGGTGQLGGPMPHSEFRAKARLMVIDDQGNEIRKFSLKLNETTPYARMSPDGKLCAYQVREDANWPGDIEVAAVIGGKPRRYTADGRYPAALDNDGNLVVSNGSRLSLLQPDGKTVDLVTDFRAYALSGTRIYYVREGQRSAASVTFP